MNEVNIMSGIDFKSNQERIRNLKEHQKKLQKEMKELKEQKRWNIIIGVLVVILIIGLLFLNKKMSDSALSSCQNKGHNYGYCINHI